MARALSVARSDIGDFTPEISPRMVSQAHFLLYNHGSRPARLVLTECKFFEFEEAVQDLLLVLQVHVSRDLRKPVFGGFRPEPDCRVVSFDFIGPLSPCLGGGARGKNLEHCKNGCTACCVVFTKSLSLDYNITHFFAIQFNVPFKIISVHMRRANQWGENGRTPRKTT